MNLIVDIGNSVTKIALFGADKKALMHRRVKEGLRDTLQKLLTAYPVEACAYACVGNENEEVQDFLLKAFPCTLHVTGETPVPLKIDYQTPHTLGADRLAAAVGAASLQPEADLLIVDTGTCVTYDYVSRAGHYLGGNISPGLGMRMRTLHEQTAKLPLVSTEGNVPPIGYDTETAIRSGVIRGMHQEINGFIRAFLLEHPAGRIFLTGGNAYRFAPEREEVQLCEALVEIGLNRILLYNK